MGTLRRRTADERGIALVMAVGMVSVLSIALAAVIAFTTANQGSTRHSQEKQDAFSLAEAGVNNAFAVLANASSYTDSTLLPARTTTYPGGGAVTWSGSYDATARRWTIDATATVSNPTGAAPIVRRVTSVVDVVPAETQNLNAPSWNYVYAEATGSTCDLTLNNSVEFKSRLYVAGNLCLDNGSRITGGPVHVGGNVRMYHSGNTIGTSSAGISEVVVGGQCAYRTDPLGLCEHGPRSTWDEIYVSGQSNGYDIPTTMPSVSAPVADWNAMYATASPGPNAGTCTSALSGATVLSPSTFDNDGVLNGSVPTAFNLAPRTYSYSCKTGTGPGTGELTWNHSTRKLTIRGTVFIDGDALIDSSGTNPKAVDYDGKGVLYLGGMLTIQAQTYFCAVVRSDACNFDLPPTAGAWDPNTELFTIAARKNGECSPGVYGCSVVMHNNSQYQGALYAEHSVLVEQSSQIQGPIFGNTIFNGNSAQTISFPTITAVPAGMPGNPVTTWALRRPSTYVDHN